LDPAPGEDARLESAVRAAQAGDAAALEKLARAVYPLVHRWARAYAGVADEAEDIAQDALLRVVRGLPTFRFDSRFTTWVYCITRRAAADTRRRNRRRLALLRRSGAYDRGGPAFTAELGGIERRVDVGRATATVRCAFARLPARQREVFELADLQGVPLVEIADRLGLAAVTVRVHLLRARRALRDHVLREHAALAEDFHGLPNGA
jgi:RNA polymerase sigma-70 factor (ECF subfamily)